MAAWALRRQLFAMAAIAAVHSGSDLPGLSEARVRRTPLTTRQPCRANHRVAMVEDLGSSPHQLTPRTRRDMTWHERIWWQPQEWLTSGRSRIGGDTHQS